MSKKVVFVKNEHDLKKLLQSRNLEGEAKVFSWTLLSKSVLAQLHEKNVNRVDKPAFSQAFKEKFIEEYAQLITAITRDNNNNVWLASDAASKNRFSSELPFLLEKFIFMLEIIQSQNFNTLIVVEQPWATLKTLRGYFEDKEYELNIISSYTKERILLVFGHVRKIAAAVKNGIKVYGRGIEARRVLKERINTIEGKDFDYVIKTFVYDKSSPKNNTYIDAFFGTLPEYLVKKKKILILANVLGNYRSCIQDFKDCTTFSILPYEAFITLGDILGAIKDVMAHRVAIRPDIEFFDFKVESILKRIVLDKTQFHQLVHYNAITNLKNRIGLKTFLMTYENYPWERMCVRALRKHAPDVRILGYQHTVVPEAFMNMFIKKSEIGIMPLPDKILTTGEISREIIEKYSELDEVDLDVACGLRFEYLFKMNPNYQQRKVQNILVALEVGFEQYEIVQYLLDQFNDHQLNFRIRSHPNFPWKRYEQRFSCNLDDYKNFSDSSRNTLQDDLEWADIVIYSGTTVGLEGLMLGKPIIHFDRGAILSFDPLFQCQDLKWTLSSQDSFDRVVDEINELSAEEFKQRQSRARDYTRRYFLPNNESNLEKFIR